MAGDPRTIGPEHHRGSYGYAGGQGAAGGYGDVQQASRGQGTTLPVAARRISWGAVIAGTVVALVVLMMLTMLGIGIGATQVEPGAAQALPEGFGIGAAVWWIVSVLIALFIGGWFAGYLAGIPEWTDGVTHGIVTWGLAMLLSAWFATTAVGAVTAGAWNVLEGGITAVGQQPGVSPQALEQMDAEARQQLEQAIAQAQREVAEVADDAAEAVAQAGIWGFIAMLLGAVVAALGGLVGAMQTTGRTYTAYPHGERRDEDRERERERGRYDYERAERERGQREGAGRETVGGAGHEQAYGYEREGMGREDPADYEREQQRLRLERERAERERAERERGEQT